MSRLPMINPDTATGTTRDLLAAVKAALGVTPNMTKVMANSPALLRGYLAFSGALDEGALTAPVREQLALTVAEANGCSYCLSAHSYLAKNVAKVSDDAVEAARYAESTDPKTRAALRFAAVVNHTRGGIGDTDLDAARAAGLSDEELAEIVGHVALNVLTNYFNKAADVDVDFPVVIPHPRAA